MAVPLSILSISQIVDQPGPQLAVTDWSIGEDFVTRLTLFLQQSRVESVLADIDAQKHG